MLAITVPGPDEVFNAETQEFATVGDVVLELEHSLVSLSKWEGIFEKPFLDVNDKTSEEVLGYVKAMVLNPNVSEEVFRRLTKDNFDAINTYIDAKMTATWFAEAVPEPRSSREIITAELVYYWMTVFHIPFECEHWHLNRLFTLIKICNIKQSKPKKMSRADIAARNREINEKRKAQFQTKG